MGTLRDRYHGVGNKINKARLGVGVVKKYLTMMRGGESDREYVRDAVEGCEVVERALEELELELAAVKKITYGVMQADKDEKEFLESVAGLNQAIKVLLVDDEADVCTILKKSFKRMGYSVETALNVADARARIFEFSPDIVLLDLYLEGEMDGLEVLKVLKESFPGTKCIVVTRIDDEERLKRVRELGPEEILFKPVCAGQLELKLNALAAKVREVAHG